MTKTKLFNEANRTRGFTPPKKALDEVGGATNNCRWCFRTTNKQYRAAGFTLIELLIVIAIIAALAALAFVALNPLARFQDSRNAQRWADVNALMSAIKLDQVDNGGTYLSDISSLTADLYYQIGGGENCNDTCSPLTLPSACVDLSGLVNEYYMSSVPIDPNASGANADETRYYICRHAGGAITVGSCSEELGSNSSAPDISVTR